MMLFTVNLIYPDGGQEVVTTFSDIGEAANAALQLADSVGRDYSPGRRPRPIKVAVYRGGQLEIAVHIVDGGLRSGGGPMIRQNR